MVKYDAKKINGVLYYIDFLGYGKIENLEIFYEKNGKMLKATKNDSEEEGSVKIIRENGRYSLKIFAPAINEKKIFIFKYKLARGIKAYKDIAQLNRKFVGTRWTKSIKNICVNIVLPQAVEEEQIYAFGHGARSGKIEIVDSSRIKYSLKNYNPGEFLEVNLLFPVRILTSLDSKFIIDENGLDKILKMEESFNNFSKNLILILVFAFIWWIFVVYFNYVKNAKRYKITDEESKYFYRLPDDYSPSIAGTLLTQKEYPGIKQLFAMILELIRKEAIRLDILNNEILFVAQKERYELSEEERFIYNWLVNELGNKENFSFEEICKSERKLEIFHKNYKRWRENVYSDMLSKNLTWDKPNRFAIILGNATGIIYFMGGFFLTSYFNIPIFIVLSFMGFFLFPYTNSRKRNSFEKEKATYRWTAFKKYLIEQSSLKSLDIKSIQYMDEYMPYAVALEISEKTLDSYCLLFSEKEKLFSEFEKEKKSFVIHNYFHKNGWREFSRVLERMERVERDYRHGQNSTSFRGNRNFSSGSSGGGGGAGGGGAF